jgi:hypothetical protein
VGRAAAGRADETGDGGVAGTGVVSEPPDVKNLDDGVAGLDGRGEATVTLPDWFEALNRDFRYPLTAIGAAAPGLHVARKLDSGRFAIAGGVPGMEVSWQVTGTRHDAWANLARPRVEQPKPPDRRGRYLTPEAFGRPLDAAIGRLPQDAPVEAGLAGVPAATPRVDSRREE